MKRGPGEERTIIGQEVKKVAVKMMGTKEKSCVMDMAKEMELIAGCDHKNIVQFIGFYYPNEALKNVKTGNYKKNKKYDSKEFNIVTEYMPGGDLKTYLADLQNVSFPIN